MKRVFPSLLGIVCLSAAALLWALQPGAPQAPASPGAEKASETRTVHYVSPQKLGQAGAAGAANATVEGIDQRGQSFHWPQSGASAPLVMIFVKQGCPCSVDFEPYFHQLAAAYDGVAQFVGVIDAGQELARQYADQNETPYPILADAERRLIDRFGAKNGAYVALLLPGGGLEMLWPGCSADMFRELSERIAAATAGETPALTLAGLPDALVTGCPFVP